MPQPAHPHCVCILLPQVCNLSWSKNVNEIVSTHGYSQNQVGDWVGATVRAMMGVKGQGFKPKGSARHTCTRAHAHTHTHTHCVKFTHAGGGVEVPHHVQARHAHGAHAEVRPCRLHAPGTGPWVTLRQGPHIRTSLDGAVCSVCRMLGRDNTRPGFKL